jgi:hypothetical protein
MDRCRLAGQRMLTSRPTIACIIAVLFLTVVASVSMSASTARRAEAICTGAGSPQMVSHYDGNGTLVAQEYVTYPGTTCNNDSTYQGAVLDPITDGSCAYAYYVEPLAYSALQGVSCTTGAWSVYRYNDSIGTNSVFVSVRPSYLPDQWWLSSGY